MQVQELDLSSKLLPGYFELPPPESRFPETTWKQARNGFQQLIRTPVGSSPQEIRAVWTDEFLLNYLQGMTPLKRLGARILDLPDALASWLIGGSRDTFEMKNVWFNLRSEMSVIAIKGGDVQILADYLAGKRNDLPPRTELDFCTFELGGTPDHLKEYGRGFTDGSDGFNTTPTRTNPNLWIHRFYNDQSQLVGEAQYPFIGFPYPFRNYIEDMIESPLTVLSPRIFVANCGNKLRYFLADPLGGFNDWYGEEKPIAKPTDPNIIAEAPWVGFGFPYAACAIAYADAELPESTLQFMKTAYRQAKQASILNGGWEIAKEGIKDHILKLSKKLPDADKIERFWALIAQITGEEAGFT